MSMVHQHARKIAQRSASRRNPTQRRRGELVRQRIHSRREDEEMGDCMELALIETGTGKSARFFLVSQKNPSIRKLSPNPSPHYTRNDLSSSLIPQKSIARGIPGLPKHLLPFPVEFTFTLSFSSMSAASNHLKAIFASLDIEWQYRPSIATGIGFAKGNVWSRAARRQQYHHQQEKRNADTERRHESMQEDEDEDEDEDEEDEEDEGPKLGFKIQLSQKITMTTLPSLNRDETGNKAGSVVILVRWIKGTDKVLFESLCGMVRSRLIAA